MVYMVGISFDPVGIPQSGPAGSQLLCTSIRTKPILLGVAASLCEFFFKVHLCIIYVIYIYIFFFFLSEQLIDPSSC